MWFFWVGKGKAPLVEADANALLAVERCVESNFWADLRDSKVCRAAARPKKIGRTHF